MIMSNIAFLDENAGFHVREDRGGYAADIDPHDTAVDHAKHLHKAQGQIGEALNLAGLLLAALEDQGDRRAMQVHAAVAVIEKKLRKACNRLDKHEARHTKLFLAYTDLRGKAEGPEQG